MEGACAVATAAAGFSEMEVASAVAVAVAEISQPATADPRVSMDGGACEI